MIIKYYHGDVSLDTLSMLCKTSRNGTSAYHIIKAAEEVGFRAEGMRCDMDHLIQKTIHLPVIAHTACQSYLHYVVLYEINKKNKYLIVGDPSVGIKKMSFFDFYSIYNHTILTFIPQKKLPREENTTSFRYNLFNIFKHYKTEYILFLVLSIFFTIFSISSTFYLSFMTESIVYQSYSYLFSIFLIFFLFYLCKAISAYFRNLILIYIHTKIDYILTEETMHQILSLPYSYYKNHTTGDVVSRVSDISTIKEAISKMFVLLFVDFLLSFLSFLFLYQIEKVFSFIAFLCAFSYIFISLLFHKRARFDIQNFQRQRSDTFNYLFECIAGFESIKGLHLEEKMENMFCKNQLKLIQKTHAVTKTNTFIHFLGEMIESFGYLFIVYFACSLAIRSSFSIPLLFIALSLYQYSLIPMKSLFLDLPFYQEAFSSYQRVVSLFRSSPKEGFLSYPIKGNIEIRNLTFSYLEETPLLQNVSFSIQAGEKVLFLGKSGAGKSTFLKILKRYYRGKRGSIFLDGVDLYDYTKEQIEEDIGYISQNETLFTGTLYENIVMNREKDMSLLLEVMKICVIDPILKKDPLGIYQLIEEGGYHLSGGEKQRIILARCLMHSFPILLIDEGFSEMDTALERQIVQGIFQTHLKNTIIVVSHRMENIDLYDKVIQFGKGEIMEFQRGSNGNYRMV